MGRWDEALAAYQQAATLNPGRSSLFSDQADILGAKGDLTGAISAYQKALRLESRWETHLNLGQIYAAAKRFEEAQRSYQTAATLNPAEGRIFARLGDLLFAQHQYSEAITAYQRCLTLNPTDVRTWYNFADACLFENRYREAEAGYQRALSLDPNSPGRAETGIANARTRGQSMGQVNGNQLK
jgi:tetratricopeptide (TPR) repeat protein